MNVLPMELWMQVFQDMWPKEFLKQMTTCRLFHSLLEAQLYEDVRIFRHVYEDYEDPPKVLQSTLFVQTLTARPELFSLIRTLRLYASYEDDGLDNYVMPKNNYWNHPLLWQLPCFPQLRHLVLEDIHIDADCYTTIRSLPRLEHLQVEKCNIDAALLDLQPFQGNTISKLSIEYPKNGDRWAALMTPGIHTFTMESPYEDLHMNKILRGLLSCDLRRTLTKLEWTMDVKFHKELCQFIEPCVQLESLSITHRYYPRDDAAKRSSHFEELSSGSLPILSKIEGSAEYVATIVAGRSVHTVSLQLWNNTPKDVLLALQLSKVPVTKLVLSQGDCSFEDEGGLADTGLYLEHVPKTIEILSVHEMFDKEKLQSWVPDLSNLSHLRTIYCDADSGVFTQIEAVRLLSEACPSIREIFFRAYHAYKPGMPSRYGNWVWRNDGSWEHYPVDWRAHKY